MFKELAVGDLIEEPKIMQCIEQAPNEIEIAIEHDDIFPDFGSCFALVQDDMALEPDYVYVINSDMI